MTYFKALSAIKICIAFIPYSYIITAFEPNYKINIMDNLVTSREAQKLAKIGLTAFYMAKRFNPKEFPREHIVFCGKNHNPKHLYNKEDVIEFFLVKYPNFGG
ncbi:hypothetical protein D4F84_00700 [Salmonella enterica subsp. enterica serovar Braenderup]|nr:hypothetical protein [Salmonella enterica subsp. enterica serovar Braenderup]